MPFAIIFFYLFGEFLVCGSLMIVFNYLRLAAHVIVQYLHAPTLSFSVSMVKHTI